MQKHPFLLSFLLIGVLLAGIGGFFLVVLSFIGSDNATMFSGKDGVAILEIEGGIFDSTETLRDIDRLRKKDSVKAVVIRINSPGGAVAPSQEIFEEVKKLKKEKKVVISMGTLAASGGYYIAVAGDKIVASGGTITGSIGVIMESMNVGELLKAVRLEKRTIKSGKYKDAGSPFRPMTPEEEAYLQAIIDNMYDQFKSAIVDQRGISPEEVSELAQGKIYTGEQALRLKLVDRLGNLYDAIDEAKALAGLPADAPVFWPANEESPLALLMGKGKISLAGITADFLDDFLEQTVVPLWLYRNP